MQTWWNNRVVTTATLALCLVLSGCATSTSVRNNTAQKLTVDKTEKVSSIYAQKIPQDSALMEASARWQSRVNANPKDAQAQLNLGVLLRTLENFEAATKALNAASQLLEDPTIALNEIGILQRVQGDFSAAENTYRQILAQRPDFHDAHFNLGILYDLYLRRPVDAQTHYQTYISNAPDADARVEKWLADLVRRHKLDSGATAVVASE